MLKVEKRKKKLSQIHYPTTTSVKHFGKVLIWYFQFGYFKCGFVLIPASEIQHLYVDSKCEYIPRDRDGMFFGPRIAFDAFSHLQSHVLLNTVYTQLFTYFIYRNYQFIIPFNLILRDSLK